MKGKKKNKPHYCLFCFYIGNYKTEKLKSLSLW